MDLATGDGVAEAVRGCEVVLHAASDPRHAQAVDAKGTRVLAAAASASGVEHLIYVSIVGIDRIPFGYYRAKLAAERAVEESSVPFSILRATQFHWFVDAIIGAAWRFPVVAPLPTKFLVQSVAEAEVAARLMRIIETGPQGRVPDFGGPEIMSLGHAADVRREVRGNDKRIVHLPLPGRVAAGFRAGANTAPRGDRGLMTWRQWLEANAMHSSRS